ncbi:MAG: HlyD family efflux transporter periplasmic adaptor subunit [Gammaproteobacteria bacterium]|nr:HlyD family efflux transporter periplasmic adaptor subunit [Gammaproteobacteria bacterium]MDP2141630.1 HlyD family efflux transporter periplasmic adaptor subunit [Gammaproteobacteria bacterium]MDP2346351.1 HlyD family efflux transporter periplasmic adaptor subunit [Gammaproteobacteria bacterium]
MNSEAKGTKELQEKLTAQVRQAIETSRARFLAASRNTRIAILGGAGVFVVVGLSLMGGSSDDIGSGTTFTVRQGPFDVVVLEGGNVEALQSQQIRSTIKGRDGTKILGIVEEGYRVTAEDVAAGMILVELDSAQLEAEKLNQEITYETAEATFVERKAQLEIRINQNVSNLNSAQQSMKFARLDFEKFLGLNVVGEIVETLEIEARLAESERANIVAAQAIATPRQPVDLQAIAQRRSRAPASAETFDPASLAQLPAPMRERIEAAMAENGGQLPAEMLQRMQALAAGGGAARTPRTDGASPFAQGASSDERRAVTSVLEEPAVMELAELSDAPIQVNSVMLMDASYMSIRNTLDFSVYASTARLEDGEAKQRLRELEDALRVAEEDHLQAQARLDGQRRLQERGFITPTELELEEVKVVKTQIRLDSAATELRLYQQYSFPKDAEQFLANYENAIMSYQRTRAEGQAELAQAEAQYKSAEKRLNLEGEKLADLNNQLAATVIRAQRPGLVVYGSAEQTQQFRGGNNQEPIAEGATVRERQPILTIPDLTEMAVRVNIHESAVQRVAEGQKVALRVDAFPNINLTGVVTKVAVVADSGNSFMNPDLKVYPSMVKIDGVHEWLRPGMSAQVEILVERLDDAIYVPLQAVTYYDNEQVVYVVNNGRSSRRVVEVGSFSEQFIQITSGLRPGEEVMLLPPRQNSVAAVRS